MPKKKENEFNLTAQIDTADIMAASQQLSELEQRIDNMTIALTKLQAAMDSITPKAALAEQLSLLLEASRTCKGTDAYYPDFSDTGSREALCEITRTMLDVYRQLKLDDVPASAPTVSGHPK